MFWQIIIIISFHAKNPQNRITLRELKWEMTYYNFPAFKLLMYSGRKKVALGRNLQKIGNMWNQKNEFLWKGHASTSQLSNSVHILVTEICTKVESSEARIHMEVEKKWILCGKDILQFSYCFQTMCTFWLLKFVQRRNLQKLGNILHVEEEKMNLQHIIEASREEC